MLSALTDSYVQSSPGSPDSLLGEGDADMLDGAALDLGSLPPHVRERIIRLQHENKMLKLQKSENEDDQSEMLKSLLDDANARKNELESELRISNQRVLELGAQLEDLQESQTRTAATDETTELRKKLSQHMQKTSQLEGELQQKQAKLDELQPQLATHEQTLNQLKEQLAKKEEEMRQMEDRYKRYLEKAKNVIKTLDPKHNSGPAPEVQALRNQLQEKDRLLDHLEKEHDKAKAIKEQEEKLIVSAWYNLGMNLHRRAAEERLANSGAGQSFLARQRQAHTRRAQSVNSPHATANAR